MSVRNTAHSSMTRCQSLFRRERRETSVTSTRPTSPRPIAATRRWKPRRCWLAGSRQAEVVIDDADVGVRPAHLPRPLDQSVLAAGALLVGEHLLRRRLPDVDEGAQTGVARLHLGRAAHGASAPPEPCGSTGAGAAGRPTAPPWGRAPRSAGWPRWSGSSP